MEHSAPSPSSKTVALELQTSTDDDLEAFARMCIYGRFAEADEFCNSIAFQITSTKPWTLERLRFLLQQGAPHDIVRTLIDPAAYLSMIVNPEGESDPWVQLHSAISTRSQLRTDHTHRLRARAESVLKRVLQMIQSLDIGRLQDEAREVTVASLRRF